MLFSTLAIQRISKLMERKFISRKMFLSLVWRDVTKRVCSGSLRTPVNMSDEAVAGLIKTAVQRICRLNEPSRIVSVQYFPQMNHISNSHCSQINKIGSRRYYRIWNIPLPRPVRLSRSLVRLGDEGESIQVDHRSRD